MGGEFDIVHGVGHEIRSLERHDLAMMSAASAGVISPCRPGSRLQRRLIGAVDAGEVLELAGRAFL
jgi:hypothetical protein